MIILGIDPGTYKTGYGLIQHTPKKNLPLDYGCICPPKSAPIAKRLLIIYDGICSLIKTHQPKALAVEGQFFYKNAKSALFLGKARAMALLAAEQNSLSIEEFAPKKVKKAVVGNGSASKSQVQYMICSLLNLTHIPPEDAADALALALTYTHLLSSEACLPT